MNDLVSVSESSNVLKSFDFKFFDKVYVILLAVFNIVKFVVLAPFKADLLHRMLVGQWDKSTGRYILLWFAIIRVEVHCVLALDDKALNYVILLL